MRRTAAFRLALSCLALAACAHPVNTAESRAPSPVTTPAVPAAPSVASAPPVETGELPLGAKEDADSLLVDVQSLAPDIRVDLRYRDSANFTGAPLPGYEANRAMLRREAAAALARVQRDVSDSGWTLLVYDAYRPVRATEAMVAWTARVGRTDLVRDGYIASRSRHNLGIAIDLTLADGATGTAFPMGTPFDTFSAAAHTANATGASAVNRRRLVRAMERHGFTNYDQEWWHFSFPVERPLRFDVPIL
jgi:D-alanyl-D-alanine dipeptidase